MAKTVAGPHGHCHRTAGLLAYTKAGGASWGSGCCLEQASQMSQLRTGPAVLPATSRGTFQTRFRFTALWESLSSPWLQPANGKQRLQGQPVTLVGKRQSLLDAVPTPPRTSAIRLLLSLGARRLQGHRDACHPGVVTVGLGRDPLSPPPLSLPLKKLLCGRIQGACGHMSCGQCGFIPPHHFCLLSPNQRDQNSGVSTAKRLSLN